MSETSESNLRLMEKICWYYYCEGLTQQHIAKILGLTRIKVIKFLEEGRQKGVVSFHVTRLNKSLSELERRMVKTFKLDEVVIIPTPKGDSDVTDMLAIAAANYVGQRLSRETTINIGYGKTTVRMLNRLAVLAEWTWSAVALTGGVNVYLPNIESDVYKAKLHLYPAPLRLESVQLRDSLMNQREFRSIIELAKKASLTVFSPGGLTPEATFIQQGLFEENDYIYFKRLGAVGDILGHFVDKDGAIVDPDTDNRLITTSFDVLRTLGRTVMVSGGKDKTEVIKAALKLKLCKVFITDEKTATDIMAKS
ncbi:MAG: hypothetical protein J6M93_02120 [Succinivibrio sp.]|nr:hypothetical protein [Succinivibrio sp.]